MTIRKIKDNWDLVVIGGGITGAGIFREAIRNGIDTILLEQKDFAWGASSRSTKMVHGGLRYLKQGHFCLTRDAVIERQRLLKEAPGLVEALGFLFPIYNNRGPSRIVIKLGLAVYDLIALKWQHKYYNYEEFLKLIPNVKKEGLIGGFHFFDAKVDDARLVQRLINESVNAGGKALNYTAVTKVERDNKGYVKAIFVQDTETHDEKMLLTKTVINATGPWAERLHISPDPKRHLRPLRGSHIVIPSSVLPISKAVCFAHPADSRMVFVSPWEGVVIVGTTDLSHKDDLMVEPAISKEEFFYLMEALKDYFPSINISAKDCISTFAGIRPVLSKGKLEPSEESREHVVWVNKGFITITGGKLTTFRKLAFDTLKAAMPFLKFREINYKDKPVFENKFEHIEYSKYGLTHKQLKRLLGRYGKEAYKLIKNADTKELTPVPGTYILWAELPFTAKHEQIRHLSDLMLRRVRLGLLLPQGGKKYLDQIQKLCEPVLPWDKDKWEQEKKLYLSLWEKSYNVPYV
mmetsp:Transcript_14114/g.6966  ORF Transcript_14114/g.6966 Transcript_14114/m.6966 type:complete len:520 (+) Transcript_14114:65-1624(+)